MYEASLIVTFYNKIDEFKLVLESIKLQTFNNFELIIADDGSNKKAVGELKRSLERFPFDLQHIWHEDKGFRKTTILNKAINASRSAYLIFMDGDCILHSKFVEEHISNRKRNTVLAGKRVNLSKKVTEELTAEKVRNRVLERYYLLYLLRIFFDFHDFFMQISLI